VSETNSFIIDLTNKENGASTFEQSEETAWVTDILKHLEELKDADIVLDVDGTIYAGRQHMLRPGADLLLESLSGNNNRVHFWSRSSREHAAMVAEAFGLTDLLAPEGFHDKPSISRDENGRPRISSVAWTFEAACSTLGFRPDAIIDNEHVDLFPDAPEDVVQIAVPTYNGTATAQVTIA
jgi:hypothetical protein